MTSSIYKATTPHIITPSDATSPLLYATKSIIELTIYDKGIPTPLRPHFVEFLEQLQTSQLERLVFHWKSLDWSTLDQYMLVILVKTLSIPTITQLEIIASTNLPLSILRYLKTRCLVFSTFTSVVTSRQISIKDFPRQKGTLTHMKIFNARNMRQMRAYVEGLDSDFTFLHGLKSLSLTVGGSFAQDERTSVTRAIGSLLEVIAGHCVLTDLLIQVGDVRLCETRGDIIKPEDIKWLICLENLHIRFRTFPINSDDQLEAMTDAFKTWLNPIFDNLPAPENLKVLNLNWHFSLPSREIFRMCPNVKGWLTSIWWNLQENIYMRFPNLKVAHINFGAGISPRTNWQELTRICRPLTRNDGVEWRFEAQDCQSSPF